MIMWVVQWLRLRHGRKQRGKAFAKIEEARRLEAQLLKYPKIIDVRVNEIKFSP